MNSNLLYSGDEKNWFASYMSACHKFSNLSSKILGKKLLFHSSIRFKNERYCFDVVSLCRASFRIVISNCVYQIWPLRYQSLMIIWRMGASYIGACTDNRITWCMHLHTKPPDHSTVSYVIACTWMQGNRVIPLQV